MMKLPGSSLGLLVGGYALVVNVGAFGLFGLDKFLAVNKQYRVPENVLHGSALLGGWIGGMFAMQTFRHKTVKQSFQVPYFVGGNCLSLCLRERALTCTPTPTDVCSC